MGVIPASDPDTAAIVRQNAARQGDERSSLADPSTASTALLNPASPVIPNPAAGD